MRKCEVDECKRTKYGRFNGMGIVLCRRHWDHKRKYGKILIRTRSTPNQVVIKDNKVEIILYYKNHEERGRAVIDIQDMKKVEKYKWSFSEGYAATWIDKKKIRLHTLLLPKKENMEIDHIDTDRTNNCRSNLRYVTHHQNVLNRKGVKGCYFRKRRGKWIAQIQYNYKNMYLCQYDTEKEANNKYLEARVKYFGEYRYKAMDL